MQIYEKKDIIIFLFVLLSTKSQISDTVVYSRRLLKVKFKDITDGKLVGAFDGKPHYVYVVRVVQPEIPDSETSENTHGLLVSVVNAHPKLFIV